MIDIFLGTVELTLCDGQSLGAVVVVVDGCDAGSGEVLGSVEGEKYSVGSKVEEVVTSLERRVVTPLEGEMGKESLLELWWMK